ncbi:peptide-methionine (R)-S-oxide reductase MsrB [Candidatus Roizmanbacteria bacterium]|nr:peptide-methionine (R)-S-oxide reductase MsrB [Candidatus Roizmanbacteria bacterium]
MNNTIVTARKLTAEQKHILQDKGTEEPFSGKYVNNKESGMYACAQCGTQLFSSDTKFESGTGWPSFYDVATKGNVKLQEDRSHGMVRTEVVCANCGGHLGHLFHDGPEVTLDGKECTGLRYCINSLALDFKEKK